MTPNQIDIQNHVVSKDKEHYSVLHNCGKRQERKILATHTGISHVISDLIKCGVKFKGNDLIEFVTHLGTLK